MRRFSMLVLAAGVCALSLQTAVAEGYTTRIEPRAYYGATVTIEEGVRVYRPLPAHRQIIINPGGQTPLSLGFNETRVIEQSTSYNYYENDGVPAIVQNGSWGSFGSGYWRGGRHHNRGGHSGKVPGMSFQR